MIKRIVGHMYWSNREAIAWLQANPDAPEKCLRLLSHILNAEKLWKARARREDYDREIFKVHPLGSLVDLNEANHAGFLGLLDLDLLTPVEYRLLNGSPGRTSIEDMILHVFSHGFHHMGQMAALAVAAGKKFPDVSYLGFTRSR